MKRPEKIKDDGQRIDLLATTEQRICSRCQKAFKSSWKGVRRCVPCDKLVAQERDTSSKYRVDPSLTRQLQTPRKASRD